MTPEWHNYGKADRKSIIQSKKYADFDMQQVTKETYSLNY